jgi:uncharacterized protein HemX
VNLLIIGGLLVLAVVAILGAVLLSRSGEANGAATKTTPALQAPSQPSTPPAPATEASSEAANRQYQSLLNGQFHEMAGEIRTLHQQARQLEQRLSALSEMVNQIALTRNDDGSVETDAHRSPSESIAE